MGYNRTDGSWADTDAVTFFDLASVAGTTVADVVETDRGVACLDLVVTSGTGTLDVTIDTSADNSTWRTAGTAFTQATGATTQRLTFLCDRYVRCTATIGTGPFTFSVSGEFR